MIVRCQCDLVNKKESILPVCYKPYHMNKRKVQVRRLKVFGTVPVLIVLVKKLCGFPIVLGLCTIKPPVTTQVFCPPVPSSQCPLTP